MISISMIEANYKGAVILNDGKSRLGVIKSRNSRTATLDGGCYIPNYGVSQSDRTFSIVTKINAEQKSLITYIHENSYLVMISCSEGFFIGSISSLDTSNTVLKMTINVESKEI